MKRSFFAVLGLSVGLLVYPTFGVSIPDGAISVVSDGGWPHEHGGGTYHSPQLDLTTLRSGSEVAIRGWVSLRGAQGPDPSGWAKYYFSWNLIDMDFETHGWAARQEVRTNFTTDNLGGWHGISPQPWDRVRLESTNLASATGEAWYCTEGGTHDVAGGGPIYPTDQLYYFQTIIDPSDRAVELWVYGKGNPGEGSAPNWNNAVDYKQWYRVSTYTIPGAFDLTNALLYPDLFASPQAPVDTVSTVRWWGMTVGRPISTQQAPPPIPEPMTMLAFGSAVAGLSGYIRRRRRA
jgi:hypothetical protein